MDDWREAFLAMSAFLGEPPEAIEIGHDLPFAEQLRDDDKARRALSLARVLGEIAIEVEDLEIEIAS